MTLEPSFGPEFDEFAGDYDAALNQGISVSGENKDYFARGRIAWMKRRLDRMGARPRTVLDYGCGTGTAVRHVLELLRPEGLVGTDISAKSVAIARQNHADPRVDFRTLAEHRPASDFDLAFCNGVFHHIPVSERAGAMRYVFDFLRPGGCFGLFENNPWSPGARLVMKRIPFDRDAVMLWPAETRRLMRDAGFEVVRTDFLFIFPRPLAFLRGLEPALCGLPLGAQYMVLGRKTK